MSLTLQCDVMRPLALQTWFFVSVQPLSSNFGPVVKRKKNDLKSLMTKYRFKVEQNTETVAQKRMIF